MNRTGAVISQLGGKRSSFKFGANASFAFAHDPRARAKSDAEVCIFDNGAGLLDIHRGGLLTFHKQLRALWLNLNFKTMTVTDFMEIDYSPSLLATYGGSVPQLYNGDAFVGWRSGSISPSTTPRASRSSRLTSPTAT